MSNEPKYYRCCQHCLRDDEGCVDWPSNGLPGHRQPCDEGYEGGEGHYCPGNYPIFAAAQVGSLSEQEKQT